MEFRILGPLEIDGPTGPIAIPAAKKRALLAALLLHPREVLARERLIDELWGELSPPTAVKALQTYISELRATLGDETIVTRPPGYELAIAPEHVDAGRFVADVRERVSSRKVATRSVHSMGTSVRSHSGEVLRWRM